MARHLCRDHLDGLRLKKPSFLVVFAIMAHL